MLARFEIWAKRTISVVWSDHALKAFDEWLVRYANESLRLATENWQSDPYRLEETMIGLRNGFGARVQHWKAEARRYRSEQIAAQEAPFEPPKTVTAAVVTRRNARVSAFRKAKGYSVADLARAAAVSETAIRGIVREDRNRFAKEKQATFLALLGISLRDTFRR